MSRINRSHHLQVKMAAVRTNFLCWLRILVSPPPPVFHYIPLLGPLCSVQYIYVQCTVDSMTRITLDIPNAVNDGRDWPEETIKQRQTSRGLPIGAPAGSEDG